MAFATSRYTTIRQKPKIKISSFLAEKGDRFTFSVTQYYIKKPEERYGGLQVIWEKQRRTRPFVEEKIDEDDIVTYSYI